MTNTNEREALIAQMFDADVAKIADRLRALADEVEQAGRLRPYVLNPERGIDFDRSAARVIHAITWGIANLSMERLVSLAGEARS